MNEANYWLIKAAECPNKRLAAIYWQRHYFYLDLLAMVDESIHW